MGADVGGVLERQDARRRKARGPDLCGRVHGREGYRPAEPRRAAPDLLLKGRRAERALRACFRRRGFQEPGRRQGVRQPRRGHGASDHSDRRPVLRQLGERGLDLPGPRCRRSAGAGERDLRPE